MNLCLGSGGVVPRALHVGRLNNNATDGKSDHFASWPEHWMSLDLSSLQPNSKVTPSVGYHFSRLSFVNYATFDSLPELRMREVRCVRFESALEPV